MKTGFQPTGVYNQFVSAPKETQNTENKASSTNSKVKKVLGAGIAIAGLYGLYRGVSYFRKGSAAINTYNEIKNNPNIVKTDITKAAEEFNKYNDGFYGKAHNAIDKARNFFKKNFYSYDNNKL